MADPDHIPEMDGLDIWTVRFYRSGLSAIALGLAWTAWLELASTNLNPVFGWLVVAAGAGLSTANLHLYAKVFRWIFQMATGAALLVLLISTLALPSRELLSAVGLTLLFVPVCGFALKEQFCFQLYGMWLLPLLLAIAVVPWPVAGNWVTATALGAAALLYSYLALAKWQMPLYFDVGDKTKYQI